MSRKRVPFLVASLTLAATMLAPHAAGATEAKARTVDGERTSAQLVSPTGTSRTPVGGQKGLADCAEGHHLSPFEMPIYDDDGLFVIGYETVWVCLPDDLEPAG